MIALPTLKPILKPGSAGATMVYRMPIVTFLNNFANTSTQYYSIGGGGSATTTIANAETRINSSGTIRNLRVHAYSNSSTTTATVRLIRNGVASALTVDFTAGATGDVENSSNSVTVAANDLLCLEIVRSSAENISFSRIAFDFLTSDGRMLHISNAANGGVTTSGGGTVRFIKPNGIAVANTTEDPVENYVPCGFTVSFFAVYISANSRPNSTTFRVRKNGANGTISISVPTLATGWFTTTTTETFVAGDTISLYSLHGGSAGTITVRTYCFETTPTVAGTSPIFMGYSGVNLSSAISPRQSTLGAQQIDINGTPNTDLRFKLPMRGSGVVRNLYCQAQGNLADVATVYELRSNNSGVGISANLPALTNGLFSDTTNTYSFTSSDSMDLQMSRAGAGAHTTGTASFQIAATQEAL